MVWAGVYSNGCGEQWLGIRWSLKVGSRAFLLHQMRDIVYFICKIFFFVCWVYYYILFIYYYTIIIEETSRIDSVCSLFLIKRFMFKCVLLICQGYHNKYHKQGALNNRNSFSRISRCQKPEIRMLVGVFFLRPLSFPCSLCFTRSFLHMCLCINRLF